MRDDGRGTGGTLLLNADIINRQAPLSEDYQTEVTRPSWRAPLHKGDRIRITGFYKNKKHAVVHGDDPQRLLHRRDAAAEGALQAVPRRQGPQEARAHRRSGAAPAASASSSGASTRPRACRTASGATTTTPSAARSSASTRASRRSRRPADGPPASRVLIANFQYLPGGRGAPGNQGLPPTVKQGESLSFVNADQQANIRHSVTTCKYPCNGRYVSNYPWADGRWDSGTLGYDAIDGGTPDPVVLDADRPPGRQVLVLLPHPPVHARRVPRSALDALSRLAPADEATRGRRAWSSALALAGCGATTTAGTGRRRAERHVGHLGGLPERAGRGRVAGRRPTSRRRPGRSLRALAESIQAGGQVGLASSVFEVGHEPARLRADRRREQADLRQDRRVRGARRRRTRRRAPSSPRPTRS